MLGLYWLVATAALKKRSIRSLDRSASYYDLIYVLSRETFDALALHCERVEQ